jgi:hypothetical protein
MVIRANDLLNDLSKEIDWRKHQCEKLIRIVPPTNVVVNKFKGFIIIIKK